MAAGLFVRARLLASVRLPACLGLGAGLLEMNLRVHVVDPGQRNEVVLAARVRVVIESMDHDAVWGTVGVSENVIEASWLALVDSFEYKLSKNDRAAASKPETATVKT